MQKGSLWMWWVVPLMIVVAGCAAKQAVSEKPSVLGREGGAALTRPAPSGPGAALSVKPEEVARSPREAVAAPKPEAGPTMRQEVIGPKPSPPAPVRPEEVAALPKATEAAASPFKDIHFDFDKYNIRSDAKSTLDDIRKWLSANRQPKVVIEGHADERGSDEYNLALGERRAESARAYLVSQGVEVGRLSTISYGEFRPIDPGKTEEAYAKNRRDHFLLKY